MSLLLLQTLVEIENEVHVIYKMASVHWSGKETHYTDQLPTPPSMAGELVPFWTICFILLLQLILVCKENLGQDSCPAALWYSIL